MIEDFRQEGSKSVKEDGTKYSQPLPGQSLQGVYKEMEKNITNRTSKDTVFRDLFTNPKYVLELYQCLHPEDKTTKKEDIEILTMKNVLLNRAYNDLGFMASDKLIILVEAQSTWSMNIIIRSLMYLVQTWLEYITVTNQSVYSSTTITIPKAELYVIYTGKKKKIPKKYISLKNFLRVNQMQLK